MKTLLIIIVLCTTKLFMYSQNYDAEIKPDGIVFPSMTTSERENLVNPKQGQCIFNTISNRLECYSSTNNVGQWVFPQSVADIIANDYGDIIFGFSASHPIDGTTNVAIGNFTDLPDEGILNTYIGHKTGDDMGVGRNNTYLGALAGSSGSGDNNLFLGVGAGKEVYGNNNVLIGGLAGTYLSIDNKLIIESSNFSMNNYPLLYGDFEENYLTINGTVNVSELIKLEPLDDAPTCNSEDLGSVYMNRSLDKLMLCTSSGWNGLTLD